MGENIVYFLGAGCSKNFGYPLTGDIMPEILRNLQLHDAFQLNAAGKTKKEEQSEKDLLRFIELLYPGLEGQNFLLKKNGIPSIIEVLSMVDHLCFYNIPPHPKLGEEKLRYFQYLLNRGVAELLMDYQNKEFTRPQERLLEKFITPILEHQDESKVSIITTNYDLSIDEAFSEQMHHNELDYGIPYRTLDHQGALVMPPVKPLLRYYKLHGSLNWLKCELCGQYYIHPGGVTTYQAFREKIDHNNTCICNDWLKLKIVLVAPSLVRDIRDSNLLQIWKAAIEAIRTADRLIFVGYSLPGEDLAIKSVIMRGLNGRQRKKPLEVDVVQQSDRAKQNYINLFGKGIKYYKGGLKDYLG